MQPGSKATEKRLRLQLLQRDNALQSLQAANMRLRVELGEVQRQAHARYVPTTTMLRGIIQNKRRK